jgi:hypothetical protein
VATSDDAPALVEEAERHLRTEAFARRIAEVLDEGLRVVFVEFGVDRPGRGDIIVALRRVADELERDEA